MQKTTLVEKYNVPGPRYTSYPTVPYWQEEEFGSAEWISRLKQTCSTSTDAGISVYIHLPYCESLCTFCGCHKHITKKHDEVEAPYIDGLLREWRLYRDALRELPRIKELHLGGGTPSFFAPLELKRMMDGLLKETEFTEHFELSFEGHPNNTTVEHLQTLFELGFTRVSFGVQDYAPHVQQAINRIQPFEHVQSVTEISRTMGYQSISHDLVYGLPKQTHADVEESIRLTVQLKPDRLSLYSYGHVPWIKGVGQRGFDESDLPSPEEKLRMYEHAKALLLQEGYLEVGMDHFALPTDGLFKAQANGTLHRNFMGYTTNTTQAMIGLGMSAISDAWTAFAQNEKTVKDYLARVHHNKIPVFRGHLLSQEDIYTRQLILDIMCRFRCDISNSGLSDSTQEQIFKRLAPLQADGLIRINGNQVDVTADGQAFVRNIAMCFDLRLHDKPPSRKIFSQTV